MADSWVLVAYSVIAMFEQEHARCQGRAEGGGILIGSYRGPHVEISAFTTPASKDLRHPYRFVKQDPKHQRAATRAWQSSGGKDTYIGEWHTHPLGEPSPSSVDKQTWREVAGDTRKKMIFVIIAPDGWQLFRCQRRVVWTSIHPLAIIEEGRSGLVFRAR